ncbi:MAG: VOC family protein [Flavobacteriales bacterium]|nr:VOC family protein [Bacteroidota bacterium]MCB9239533.1 VOC family protein [Flavobacteriales bacterium]
MNPPHNLVGWFEIPVSDMPRAIAFYEAVFGFKLAFHDLGNLQMAWFPTAEDQTAMGATGTLVYNEEYYHPSDKGILIYFTAFSGDMNIELKRVEEAGGTVLIPKRQISPDHGYMGVFLDSEGNRVALHHR